MAGPQVAFARLAAHAFNALYRRACRRLTRRNAVVFVSRQTDVPSENFQAIGRALEERGWQVIFHTRRLSKKTLVPYTGHILEEIKLLATCKGCVLDRYDPVVALLDLPSEGASEAPKGKGASEKAVVHQHFPVQPVVFQIWHAFGSFKKFGYQSLGTREGHSAQTAHEYGIHRNYSWVLCTGEENRAPFAEAFSYPLERVIALPLPEYDKLLAMRAQRDARRLQGKSDTERRAPLKVLFAPTLRKSDESPHPFHELEAQVSGRLPAGIEAVWSYHPLEQGRGAATGVGLGLEDADVLVTDYSSMAYEASVLGIPVYFYVPDLETYRAAPGLNADPGLRCPSLCLRTPRELLDALDSFAQNPTAYPQEAFNAFVGATFAQARPGCADAIADFMIACMECVGLP